ncbi:MULTISPECIES: LPS assembly lipoprotein LptE [unclassified Marinobacterium]|jgi:LPS-assembly lipoprotein|uniref:LPS-assembly lipoprotein LptE n=1 Tax=unclassified Marinobacterium TaxID=2644139 RepID=UPI00156968A7|nr:MULTISPECIES: LPS assembly lipoprotein LptE [unclassified Marinobacterium]NRP48089.1 LPS-assembly lipoprotein RlpB [Marinobacterium sp. xm-d-543]NRQ02243.1 LPS-assembly lipoprotein RlpB [Marinobacterium sp. xm-d-530]NRQ24550.1 LPS-assembly lipoprotein RlpB [Marinobacterium sp. xm-m-312]
MKLSRTFVAGFAMLFLTACGFHLKGLYEVPPALQQLTLVENTTQPTSLGRELTTQLQRNGVTLTSRAKLKLIVESARYNRRAVILDANADAQEYELSGEAQFAIYQGDSTAPAIERRVNVQRSVTETSDTLAQETLEERYRTEINRALAEQIIRQYLSFVPR